MATRQSRYLAYMLRLWQTKDADQAVWRVSLESPHNGERVGFADLQALFDFLENRTREEPVAEEEPPVGEPETRDDGNLTTG